MDWLILFLAGMLETTWAVMHGHVVCVRVLLEAGADPNAKDATGTTVLNRAREQEMIALLREAGARE